MVRIGNVLILGLVVVALTSCGDSPIRLPWTLVPPPGLDTSDVAYWDATILEGDCDSERAVWHGGSTPDGSASDVDDLPRLDEGQWAFSGRLLDAQCRILADGCVAITLPDERTESVRVPLSAPDDQVAACDPTDCSAGRCPGPELFDAGTPMDAAMDGPAGDGRSDSGAADTGGPDAPPDTGQPDPCEMASDGVSCTAGGEVGKCRDGTCCTGCWTGSACETVEADAVRCLGTERGDLCLECGQCERCGADLQTCEPVDGLPCDSGCADCACSGVCEAGSCREGHKVAQVSTGRAHTCVVTTLGELYCTGRNNTGQLGLGDTVNRDHFERVSCPLGECTDWTFVQTEESAAVGDSADIHVCGIRSGGTLWCWGGQTYGELGIGGGGQQTEPQQVGITGGWSGVAVGPSHSCALRTMTGDAGVGLGLWCWGGAVLNGVSGADVLYSPEQVDPGTEWLQIDAGNAHTCGIQADGTLWCWGFGFDCQLGVNCGNNRGTPDRLTVDTDWSLVTAGKRHTCAIRSERLYCWGSNGEGRLGVGSNPEEGNPVEVDPTARWQWVDAGNAHTCAILSTGTLFCWGSNADGQLGYDDASISSRGTPRQVSGLDGWTEVDAGGNHTCALRGDGDLWCWGRNAERQLGRTDADRFDAPTPICL